MPTLIHDHLEIPYHLKRTRRRRSLMVRVEVSGDVTVLAPRYALKYFIQRFVEDRAGWIHRTRQKFAEHQKQNPPRRLASGESLPVWGRERRLEISPAHGTPAVRLEEDRLSVSTMNLDETALKALLQRWYADQADAKLREILPVWAARLGVTPGTVKVVRQKSRWGSCSPTNNLRFNWRLAMLPESILEYVAVHELAHIKSHDHSKRFWSAVESVLPEYKSRRLWLRKNGRVENTAL